MASYEFDVHTHSIASGHGTCATMTDMAKAANAAGLKMLGISDHGPKTLGGGRISYFRSLAFAQPKRLGVRMLYGAEVNILDQEGKLDLDDEILEDNEEMMIQLLSAPGKQDFYSKFGFKVKKEIAEDGMYMWLRKE